MTKSIFVMAFLMGAMAAAVLAAVELAGGFDLMWLGALVATAPIVAFFGALMMLRPTARTARHLPWMGALLAGGVTVAGYGYATAAAPSPLALGGAAFGLIGWLLYDYWYSKLNRSAAAGLAVGDELPDVELERAGGERVRTRDFRGRPLLLLFYRGNWCPFCMAQIRELAAQYRALADRGVRVALVSPQPHAKTRALAERFDIPCDFLVDPDSRAARELGIVHENGLPAGMQVLGYDSDTVLPTAIIADEAGRILFCDQTDNYRVRPEPETFLRILDERASPPLSGASAA